MLPLASAVALDAVPVRLPLKVVAVNWPAVVSKYTPVSNTCVPVAVVALVVPVIYALVVVAKVLVTLVLVSVKIAPAGTSHANV